MVVLKEDSLGFILWGPWMHTPNLMGIHPKVRKEFLQNMQICCLMGIP